MNNTQKIMKKCEQYSNKEILGIILYYISLGKTYKPNPQLCPAPLTTPSLSASPFNPYHLLPPPHQPPYA